MIGAIAGDIIGSIYEFAPIKTTEFPLFQEPMTFTDDSVCTIALADSILNGTDFANRLKRFYRKYPFRGFSFRFANWADSDNMKPYNSLGNGSAMRVSPVGFAYDSLEEVLDYAKKSAEVTHNHPEGITGAQATAGCIFLARQHSTKDEILAFVEDQFEYDVHTPLEEIRPNYAFNETCAGSVPQAIRCFLEANDYEESIRLAISLGGDADTLACIAGSIAHAYYGISEEIKQFVFSKLDEFLGGIVQQFCAKYHCD
jgi:ADP-ribosylglycohydrolase